MTDRFAGLRRLVRDYEQALADQDVNDIVISWRETHEALNYAVIVELLQAADQRDAALEALRLLRLEFSVLAEKYSDLLRAQEQL